MMGVCWTREVGEDGRASDEEEPEAPGNEVGVMGDNGEMGDIGDSAVVDEE